MKEHCSHTVKFGEGSRVFSNSSVSTIPRIDQDLALKTKMQQLRCELALSLLASGGMLATALSMTDPEMLKQKKGKRILRS